MTKDKALDLALEALATEEYRLRQIGQSQVYPGIGFAIAAIKQARSAPVCPACESIEWEGQPCQICQTAPVQENTTIYKTFEQWMNGNFLEVKEPRKKAYSKDELLLVEMGWSYGYDAGRAIEAKLKEKNTSKKENT